MPNEDTATPETKLTAMCERTIQQLDELSEKLDAYCRELESRVAADRDLSVGSGRQLSHTAVRRQVDVALGRRERDRHIGQRSAGR